MPRLTEKLCWRPLASGSTITNVSRRLCDSTLKYLKRLWRGEVEEKPKLILRGGFGRALFPCWIHFAPVSATITLGYLNIAGYFIGSNLQGRVGSDYQALYTLCLQVAAKLRVIVLYSFLSLFIYN